jgi:hypothetical protein
MVPTETPEIMIVKVARVLVVVVPLVLEQMVVLVVLEHLIPEVVAVTVV